MAYRTDTQVYIAGQAANSHVNEPLTWIGIKLLNYVALLDFYKCNKILWKKFWVFTKGVAILP